ncbi:hypothetical protein GCM10023170_092140 [Phytohabitans houttuyneae]|uniref:Uncharacterized protein n=1 Tax=Phytohabitans houttuyneae TaxID=1076126 RepID=A0A6V8KGL6_9ACTN|nr:hypothetical protein Phou_054090 [Phytohabitans houttuyneae]
MGWTRTTVSNRSLAAIRTSAPAVVNVAVIGSGVANVGIVVPSWVVVRGVRCANVRVVSCHGAATLPAGPWFGVSGACQGSDSRPVEGGRHDGGSSPRWGLNVRRAEDAERRQGRDARLQPNGSGLGMGTGCGPVAATTDLVTGGGSPTAVA